MTVQRTMFPASVESVGPARPEAMSRVELQPEFILPSQLLPRGAETPERRLLLAVLEEAVGTYQRYVTATDRPGRAVFADVEAWFASADDVWLYSFVTICDAIGLDATYLRSGLAQRVDTQRAPSPGMARPRHHFPFRRTAGARHRTTGRPQGVPKEA